MSDRVSELFAEVLRLDAELISDETSPDNTPQWDSLAGMSLVAALEERFGVELSTREIMAMRTVGIARSVLRDKGVEDV